MYIFANDYAETAHPRIIAALAASCSEQNEGYGLDAHCQAAAAAIRRAAANQQAEVHFFIGGTQANMTAIAAMLRPHQAVICADCGHINVHETGAVEATGHKLLALPADCGKLTPELIQPVLDAHCDEHMVQPKLVYISNSNELGCVYSHAELAALSAFCRARGLYLFMDGARLGAALSCAVNDLTLPAIAALCDAFYIGGTKNGALFGEAYVIVNDELKQDMRFFIKQRGAMLAKGWLLGIQFEQLFSDGLFYELGAHANAQAARIAATLTRLGCAFLSPPQTNQLFPILPDTVIARLREDFSFLTQRRVDGGHSAVRLITSWATPDSAVRQLCAALEAAFEAEGR